MIQYATLTCPECGHEQQQALPWAGAVSHFKCAHCKRLVEHRQGDCCVFRSYGADECPCKSWRPSVLD